MNKYQLKDRKGFASVLTVGLLVILAMFGMMDDYGAGVLNYIVSNLVHQFIDYIVLVFAVGLLLTLFAARGWVKRLLTGI